ncbi:MAG: hypothetical protein Q8P51_08940 [Ignavibacteria bacterium]|nr:hypothetical protein [Ignavibacteria bacterium]
MNKKKYMGCIYCGKRARRTGHKEEIGQSLEGRKIFLREYECPWCGGIFAHDEWFNVIR